MRRVCVLLCGTMFTAAPASAQQSIGEYTRGMERRDGYFPLYWDAPKARLLIEVPRLDSEFLYLTSLATGIGSTELGLDRGMIADDAIARFERVGPKVYLVLANPRFRAVSADHPALRRSVEESFATSTIGAFEVLAEEGGRVLLDFTPHVIGDHVGVASQLRQADQGSFSLSRDRSSVYLARTRGFPRNTEIETSLTFTSDNPGAVVRRHAPDARAITVREHLSLVALPDDGFTPRRADPRIGNFTVSFLDFSRSFDRRYEASYVARHRLKKRRPGPAPSEPVEPIVYYLDPGIPEPYRAAFRDGVSWWNRVFEAAGFVNAFRVADMPPDMDPMDARFNVIQWVHRSDPGFSIGPSFVDPRTGEILKAAVRMDTYRSLTDFNLYAGAIPAGGAAALDIEPWLASLDTTVSGEAFVMARRRQHAAHEVGHTLGLAHNFVTSRNGRSSVMDYPGPLIRLVNGRIDLSDAYRDGPGAYDSIAIRYGYTEFAPGEEEAGLTAIVQEAMRRGLEFNTDGDNATWSSFPEVTQWLNGEDGVEELARTLTVRHALLDRFDARAIREGEPLVWLNYRLVPVYLHHRYALEAAIKAVGGMEFRYAVRGDSLPPTTIIAPARQRRALELVLDALEPAELRIPERIIRLVAPRAFGYGTDEWSFGSDAYPAFDQIGAARTLAAFVLDDLFDPRRVARLVAFHARNPEVPAPEEVIARVIERVWVQYRTSEHAPYRRLVQRALVDALLDLAGRSGATVEARAAAEWGLRRVIELAQETTPRVPEDQAHVALVVADVERFLNRQDAGTERSEPRTVPPGTPIGGR